MPNATKEKKNQTPSKMNDATALDKPKRTGGVTTFPAIGTGNIVTIDPSKVRSFDDVGLGTGLFPDDMQIPMSYLVGKEVIVADAVFLKGLLPKDVIKDGKATREMVDTEYAVVRCWNEHEFKFLPEGKGDFEDEYITVEAGSFFTTATGGIVAYRQVKAAYDRKLLPLKSIVNQSKPKTKGMNGYYYFGKEVKD